jgi:hypothetical protein
MAHSTAITAFHRSPKAYSDWFTFLLSAFINGLKAYGASLMVIHLSDPTPVETKAGCPTHRAVSSRDGWETMNSALDWSRV